MGYTTETIIKELFGGFSITLSIFFWTLVFALPLGLLICAASMSKFKPLAWFSRIFVWIIRGTPLMLQVIVLFYGPPLLNIKAPSWLLANIFSGSDDPQTAMRISYVIFAFIINYGVYFSEIYRGGILSIGKGQYEAAQILQLNKKQTFVNIIMPQMAKKIVPPMSNEILTLVKDTSLARVITVGEILYVAQSVSSNAGMIWPLFAIGIFYLAFNGLLTLLFGFLEKKFDYYKG